MITIPSNNVTFFVNGDYSGNIKISLNNDVKEIEFPFKDLEDLMEHYLKDKAIEKIEKSSLKDFIE